MKPSAAYGISLTVIAFLVGLLILPVFGRYSNKAKLLIAKRKIRAALYAFRLFGDEPRLVFRAQGQLLLWNARYLGLILKPAGIVLLPILFLLLQMDSIYGHRPLHAGETTIASARVSDKVNLNTTSPVLNGSGVTVETPPIRIPEEHEVYWRVRALNESNNRLNFEVPGEDAILQKSVQVGPGMHYLTERRTQSFWDWLQNPGERRLPVNSPVHAIGVHYPDAEFSIFGIGMPWIVWFVIVSWGTMFAFRKRFGVII